MIRTDYADKNYHYHLVRALGLADWFGILLITFVCITVW